MNSSTQLGPSFIVWINTLALTLPSLSIRDGKQSKADRVVKTLADLNDGVILGEIASSVDPGYFRPLGKVAASSLTTRALADNWVLRFNSLKRLYKLVIRYFEDVLRSSTTSLPAPNLQLIAKGEAGSDEETCLLAGLVLALVVRSPQKQHHIQLIQSLDEWVQRELMFSIEQVMSKVVLTTTTTTTTTATNSPILSGKGQQPARSTDEPHSMKGDGDEWDAADSEFYALQQERSKLLSEKESLHLMYEELVQRHDALKDDHEEALGNLAAAEARANTRSLALETVRKDRSEVVPRDELERATSSLQKLENQLGDAEKLIDSQGKEMADLNRKVEDLIPKAEQAARLKDQVDEYKHAAEKGKKTENVIEKYKKKLEDATLLRRMVKSLEEENAMLLDKNTELEEEYQKVSAYKPILATYKNQLDEQKLKTSQLNSKNEVLELQVKNAQDRLREAEKGNAEQSEKLGIAEERLKELDLSGTDKDGVQRRGSSSSEDDLRFAAANLELDDALIGTTKTHLKLHVRKLERELEALRAVKQDNSRMLVLENALEDAERMRKRYEADYLKEHKEKLTAMARLEYIMSGKSKFGDGPEASVALRARLEEVEEELRGLQSEHKTLVKDLRDQKKNLATAHSDLQLVGQDQKSILKSLQQSSSAEKNILESEVGSLRQLLAQADDISRAHLGQMNELLKERIYLQDDDIGRREDIISKERDIGDLKAKLLSKGSSASDVEHVTALEEAHQKCLSELDEAKRKLQKAKAFIKQQDKLFRETHASANSGISETTEHEYRSQIDALKEDLERQKANSKETEARYAREHRLMLKAWQEVGMQTVRDSTANAPARTMPASWLGQQRAKASGRGLRYA